MQFAWVIFLSVPEQSLKFVGSLRLLVSRSLAPSHLFSSHPNSPLFPSLSLCPSHNHVPVPSQAPDTPPPTPPSLLQSPPLRMRIQSRVISWLSRPDNQQSYFTAKGMQTQTLVRVGGLKVSVQSFIIANFYFFAVCLCFFLCLLSTVLSYHFNFI